ncbi:MAG: hypothetical protein WDO71_17815 [Bacteroidota bacterium]
MTFTPSAAEKSIYNFYLLGLTTKDLFRFDEVVKEYKQYTTALKTFEEKLFNENGFTVKEYRSEKLRIEANINNLRDRLKGYDFQEAHKDIEKKLGEVISRINVKSNEYHNLSQKLKNVREAYQVNQEIDTRQVQKIYNEMIAGFGDAVKKSLDEISKFKSDILENRSKFLLSRESDLQKAVNSNFHELTLLEKERTKLLKTLQEKGVLDKLETHI